MTECHIFLSRCLGKQWHQSVQACGTLVCFSADCKILLLLFRGKLEVSTIISNFFLKYQISRTEFGQDLKYNP